MDQDDAILDYVQDRLTPAERSDFEARMARDPALAAEVQVMRSVRADLGSGPKHDKADAVWDRLSASIAGTPRPANDNRRPWLNLLQYAAVAMIAVAVWQFAVVPRLDAPDTGFRAASEPLDAFALRVKFAEDATLGDIAALLTPLAGTITDGPGALSLLRLSFPDAAARARALEALEARPDLVELVSQ